MITVDEYLKAFAEATVSMQGEIARFMALSPAERERELAIDRARYRVAELKEDLACEEKALESLLSPSKQKPSSS